MSRAVVRSSREIFCLQLQKHLSIRAFNLIGQGYFSLEKCQPVGEKQGFIVMVYDATLRRAMLTITLAAGGPHPHEWRDPAGRGARGTAS